MKGIFTILNYYFSPGRRAAQWPLATAPAAVGDRNLQQNCPALFFSRFRFAIFYMLLNLHRGFSAAEIHRIPS